MTAYGVIEYGHTGKVDGNKHQSYFKDSIIKSINSDEMASFSVYRNLNWVHKFNGTQEHQKEHEADLVGYGLLQKIANKQNPQLPKHIPLQSIVLLCTLLSLIYGDEPSYSHPSPTDRVLYIAEICYGHDFSENLRRGYEQPELLDALWKTSN